MCVNIYNSRSVQYLVASSVSLATLNYGVLGAWPSPVIPKFGEHDSGISLSETEISWLLAMGSLGFMTGSFISRFTSDNFGRRASILWTALPIAIGSILVTFAKDAWLIDLIRLMWGIGSGMIITVTTMYFAEIADKEIRGTLSMISRLLLNLGALFITSVGGYLSYWTLNYMLWVFPVCFFLACLWIPESPYFLVKEARIDEARKVLQTLRGYKDDTKLEQALISLQNDVAAEMKNQGTVLKLVTNQRYRKAVIIVVVLKLALILSGTIILPQYLGMIIKESRYPMEVSTGLVIFGIIKFIASMISTVIVDKFGRRTLLMHSCFSSGISLFVVGLHFFLLDIIQLDEDTLKPSALIAVIAINISCVISNVGFYALVYIILAEIFPMNVKAIAVSCVSTMGGLVNFGVSVLYQVLKDNTGLSGVMWMYALVSFIAGLFTLFYVPETKGKSLREIQIEYQGDCYVDDIKESMKIVINNDTVKSVSEELKALNVKENTEV